MRTAAERAAAASALVLDRIAFGFPAVEEIDRVRRRVASQERIDGWCSRRASGYNFRTAVGARWRLVGGRPGGGWHVSQDLSWASLLEGPYRHGLASGWISIEAQDRGGPGPSGRAIVRLTGAVPSRSRTDR